MAINEVKDRLSAVLAQLAETREEVEITKNGRVVARLVPPEPTCVVLGVGATPGGSVPDIDDLRWTDDELQGMFGPDVFPA
jgi:prevent-host-death family protein